MSRRSASVLVEAEALADVDVQPEIIAEVAIPLSQRAGLHQYFVMRDAMQKVQTLVSAAVEAHKDRDLTVTVTTK